MAGLMSAEEIFEKIQEAAASATGPDERALQIDYPELKEKVKAALGDRKVALAHVNKFIPEGYEDQGRFNLVLMTTGKVLFDMVIGDSYFRYDIVSVAALDKGRKTDPKFEGKHGNVNLWWACPHQGHIQGLPFSLMMQLHHPTLPETSHDMSRGHQVLQAIHIQRKTGSPPGPAL